ncbi:GDSL-type esterase/lipase family protein [Croceitalea rosinachiae]|uniref:GDSL-type esterase/lipase family protein n=1 Tax=Croceitalea rosinachiae TaxID=3075596 RepID=A0ABU3ADK6_9FLAO|nr:GDSL-type esterase/lipase family protein [Croceitalea sp. F388]MDT0608277.1 GDSL-type esterase/lipase family protein [Croceitalea sp. F388]
MIKYFSILLIVFVSIQSTAQNAFQKEVDSITRRNDSLWDNNKETIVFTGSSSIRFWTDVQERFPKYQILNSGFGGSQTADLLYHLDKLVLRYQPVQVFIYEGDNDVFARKRPRQIIKTTQEVLQQIQTKLPNSEIVLISAKPSISRWKLKGKYKRLNKRFSKIASENPRISYADVWDIMLNGRKVRTDIFIEDGLHMNKLGYDLWYEKIKSFLP